MRRLVLAIGICCIAAGCSDPGETVPDATAVTPPPAPAPAPAPATDAEPVTTPATGASVYATMKVVDLEGNALANMAPIATREPNAFDLPVATGAATDANGEGSIRFNPDEHLYLRAWDPGLDYFPNNFYEALPGGSTIDGLLQIQMVPAAQLDVQLLLPTGEPVANQPVGLMLFHPTRGPWWPAEGQTSAEGVVSFPHLPAGEYVLRFKVESGERLEHKATPLPPGSAVNLGVQTLQ